MLLVATVMWMGERNRRGDRRGRRVLGKRSEKRVNETKNNEAHKRRSGG